MPGSVNNRAGRLGSLSNFSRKRAMHRRFESAEDIEKYGSGSEGIDDREKRCDHENRGLDDGRCIVLKINHRLRLSRLFCEVAKLAVPDM